MSRAVKSKTNTGTSRNVRYLFQDIKLIELKINKNMTTKEVIYAVIALIEFVLLIAGIDWYFGEEVRNFCMILFPVWCIGMGIRNWKQIVKFFTEGLYNLKKNKK